jgi:hypothetical protein
VIRVLVLVVLCWGVVTLAFQADKRGPSTPDERARALELNRHLEAEPLAADAREARQWLFDFATAAPDLDFTVCANLLEPVLNSKYPFSSEINTQMIFSTLAFIIEHPEKAKDKQAVYMAATEGALRAYASILKVKPEATMSFLDDLVTQRDKGELAEYVRRTTKKSCK